MPWNRATISQELSKKIKKHLDSLPESNAISIDIGGTLSKVIFMDNFVNDLSCFDTPSLIPYQSLWSPELSIFLPGINANLHFFCFETFHVYDCGCFIASTWNNLHKNSLGKKYIGIRKLRATGGGSFKHGKLFREKLGLNLCCKDEMLCTVIGMNFLIAYIDHEFYTFSNLDEIFTDFSSSFISNFSGVIDFPRYFPLENIGIIFPYLLVNIGSGVSIVKVTGRTTFQRVSGSSLGGGTFWGLCSLLTNCKTFAEVIELSKKGNNQKVDMLVGDIYGGGYSTVGLDANVIAASFGKLTMKGEQSGPNPGFFKEFKRSTFGLFWVFLNVIISMPFIGKIFRENLILKNFTQESFYNSNFKQSFQAKDLALSALRTISYNIGQIAFLNAKRFGLEAIYFGGNFVRKHPYTIASISYAVKFWSRNKMRAFFSLHDGYLGALGAFLDGKDNFE
mmetsp:Transcript_43978/g.103590  ORF Transcript_43978/g.103590 Transcript_43978/m.103590 type:complete len:450 (-) Transcript_43978:1531-2880(-)